MKHKIKQALTSKVSKNFATYLGLSTIARLFPILILPILAKYLTPAEIGVVSLYQIIMNYLTPFVSVGMQGTVTVNFFKKTKEELALIIYQMILIMTAMCLVVTGVVGFVHFFNPDIISLPSKWVYSLAIVCLFNGINNLNLTLLRNQENAKTYSYFEIIKLLCDFILTLLFVIAFSMASEGRLLAIFVSSAIACILGVAYLFKNNDINCKFNWIILKNIFIFSIPFIPDALGGMVLMSFDRWALEYFHGEASLGIYSVTYQFAALFYFLVTIFNRAWQPWVYKRLSNFNEQSKYQLAKSFYVYLLVAVILANVVATGAYILVTLLFSSEYHEVRALAFVIANGFVFYGLYTLVFAYYINKGYTKKIASITFLAAILSVGLSLYFVPRYGYFGAALAHFLTQFINFSLFILFGRTIITIPWFEFKKIWSVSFHDKK